MRNTTTVIPAQSAIRKISTNAQFVQNQLAQLLIMLQIPVHAQSLPWRPTKSTTSSLTSFMANNTSIVYTNGQKSRVAALNLSSNCTWTDQIVCITEPYLGPKLTASFNSPWTVLHMGPGSRACIAAPPWATPFLLTNISTADMVFVEFSWTGLT